MLAQCAHWRSSDVGSDDDEPARDTDLDDNLGWRAVPRGAGDDALNFTGLRVALALDDLAREDDGFEVEDVEFVIFKSFGCVS